MKRKSRNKKETQFQKSRWSGAGNIQLKKIAEKIKHKQYSSLATRNSISHLYRVAPHHIIIISSLLPFYCRGLHVSVNIVKLAVIFFRLWKIIHGYTQAVIFALHVTLGGAVNCWSFKHVTLKNVVVDDILIYNKLEVLTIYCSLRHKGGVEGNELWYQQQSL